MIVLDKGFSSGGLADEFIERYLIANGVAQWVDSVNGNNSNSGSESEPVATIAQAITNCATLNGDIIVVKAGHSEVLTSAITLSKSGIKIFGIGEGANAPKITVNGAIDAFDVTGNFCEINNIYFLASTAAATARINLAGTGNVVRNCTFLCGADDASSITITSAGTYCRIENCIFTVTANGPDHGVKVESASAVGLTISNCTFNGGTHNWDLGGIYSAFAHTFHYQAITLTGDAGIAHTASAKGWMSDLIAGEGSQVSL